MPSQSLVANRSAQALEFALPNGKQRSEQKSCPFYLGGKWLTSETEFDVCCPDDGSLVASTFRPTEEHLQEAIQTARVGFCKTRQLSSCEKRDILNDITAKLIGLHEALSTILALEAGKPIKLARAEVSRTIDTFKEAASCLPHCLEGKVLPLDTSPASPHKFGLYITEPIGVVGAITPFNYPLNLVAHKIAPAIAAGCAVILKPASQTPLCSLWIARIVSETKWPKEALSVLPLDGSEATSLVESTMLNMITFTGSSDVGWLIKSRAGQIPVALELGGNAGMIVDRDADVKRAAQQTKTGFAYAGQSCISIQRVFVHADVFEEYLTELKEVVRSLVVGHPMDDNADLSSVISRNDAQRIKKMFDEISEHAEEFPRCQIVMGGVVHESRVEPTIIIHVPPHYAVAKTEAFAPLVCVNEFTEFEEAIQMVNQSVYGLQAGVFTNDVRKVTMAAHRLEVGSVIINDVPTFRTDAMPYGGFKGSGLGKEGPAYTIHEMTRRKLVVLDGSPGL